MTLTNASPHTRFPQTTLKGWDPKSTGLRASVHPKKAVLTTDKGAGGTGGSSRV